ncbi:MAG: DUF1365 domain-containing protein [Roseibium sp.]|uniref:DUF1365 domain-containing protein n=1 Tax=Roseibium sp. TaxID=1936156 RepID=UPI0026236FD2|nr:DUF1365 domain-containing protein [Roseibium sp.]MCV0426174.1 DUF1365 domain-containing protein [Roseibium sp.]
MTRTLSNSISENGPPPEGAASIYSGSVMHQRMKPREHRFHYSVFSVLLDLDRLEEANRSSGLFSVNRFNLLSFHECDHGKRDGTNLRDHIETLLTKEGVERPARILLLAYPRMLGYGFNPLSVYYAFGTDTQLSAIIYEVRNTFGGLHTYTMPIRDGQLSDAGVRQDQRKEFYVSPFVSMEQHYFFRMLPPGDSVRVRILEKDAEGPLLSATFSGERKSLTNKNIFKECLRVPLLTFKVISAIHWEAFKIWRKRVPFHSRPAKDARKQRSDGQKRRLPLASN